MAFETSVDDEIHAIRDHRATMEKQKRDWNIDQAAKKLSQLAPGMLVPIPEVMPFDDDQTVDRQQTRKSTETLERENTYISECVTNIQNLRERVRVGYAAMVRTQSLGNLDDPNVQKLQAERADRMMENTEPDIMFIQENLIPFLENRKAINAKILRDRATKLDAGKLEIPQLVLKLAPIASASIRVGNHIMKLLTGARVLHNDGNDEVLKLKTLKKAAEMVVKLRVSKLEYDSIERKIHEFDHEYRVPTFPVSIDSLVPPLQFDSFYVALTKLIGEIQVSWKQ